MTVRSRRLFDTAAIPTADGVVYTVPTGRTAILKAIALFNRDAAAQTVSMAINTSASSSPLIKQAIAGTSSVVVEWFLVLNPGDALHMIVTGANVGRVCAFGALLEGDPT